MRILRILPFLFVATTAWSAGFLDHKEGVPYKWKTFPIVYRVDPGNLKGVTIPNASAKTLVLNAFNAWQGVTIADVSFSQGTDLSTNITASNVDSYVTFDASGAPRSVTADTVIIFDEDGGILSRFGFNPNTTVGLASAGEFDDTTMEITAGVAIMSGLISNSNEAQAVMTHEFGHMLNLQHAQLNLEEAQDGLTTNDDVVPTMYFQLLDAVSMFTPKADDQFSLAYLYPSATYNTTKGKITGKILRRNGDGVRAVNVICRNLANLKLDAVSWISDEILAGKGEYVCGNLSSANYSVFIEPILNVSINIYDPEPPFIVKEFYSGGTESFDPEIDFGFGSGSEISTSVAVTAGQTKSGIKLFVNEDGRLISGQAVSGTVAAGDVSTLDFFITVPPGSNQVTFELAANDATKDIDLIGRCDNEFSLTAGNTSDPLVAKTGAQQAEFSGTGNTGVERIILNSGSSPAFKKCTYHLLVLNGTASSVDYTLKATVTGGSPRISFSEIHARNGSGGSGETEVLVQHVKAKEETFRIRGLVYTDTGLDDFSQVTGANLYEDTNGDEKFGPEDTLISASIGINTTNRKITFSGFDYFVDVGTQKTFIVTYTFPVTAIWLWFFVAIPVLPLLRRRKGGLYILLLGLVLVSNTCSEPKPNFYPELISKSDTTVSGITYGDQFVTSLSSSPASVSDFFNN